MNLMEMFVVVLAVVLFASTAIVQHQTMAVAADMVTNASHTVQALQIAQEILDEIDAKLFASNKTKLKFKDVKNKYNNNTRVFDLDFYEAKFVATTTVEACDYHGRTAEDLAAPKVVIDLPNWLVTVNVQGPDGQKHPVTLSRVYTFYSMEDM